MSDDPEPRGHVVGHDDDEDAHGEGGRGDAGPERRVSPRRRGDRTSDGGGRGDPFGGRPVARPARPPRSRRPASDRPVSTRGWQEPDARLVAGMRREVVLDCGWGRLLLGQTFAAHDALLEALRAERHGRRDIAMYVRDPHVLVAKAPGELFIDPSYTFRLEFHRYEQRPTPTRAVRVRKMTREADADAINRLYAECGMVVASADTMWANQRTQSFTYLLAEDEATGDVVGTVTGVDHVQAFADPDGGTSLWCLAVAPQAPLPGVGSALVRALVERYMGRNRGFLDLSVLHDNAGAVALYRKLGFERVPVFAVKRKNPINEKLFAAPSDESMERLNPYARIVADEAMRRGVLVEVLDPEWGELRLSFGGRQVLTRESLSELTTAVAMSRCDDKRVTRRVLSGAGIRVPRGQVSEGGEQDAVFADDVGELVVKPARGEQGVGITVGVRGTDALAAAVEAARAYCPTVLLEELVSGSDLRVVVIADEVVAAAVRRPPVVTGDGRTTVRALVTSLSRRRSAATGGEARIPLDDATQACVADGGHDLDDVLRAGEELLVRRTANLHTGGTISDVTARLHPELVRACVTATRALGIPVAGLDLLVPDVEGPDYVMIEVNERPGLANHEPQPTAEKFVDLLFPATRALPRSWTPQGSRG